MKQSSEWFLPENGKLFINFNYKQDMDLKLLLELSNNLLRIDFSHLLPYIL